MSFPNRVEGLMMTREHISDFLIHQIRFTGICFKQNRDRGDRICRILSTPYEAFPNNSLIILKGQHFLLFFYQKNFDVSSNYPDKWNSKVERYIFIAFMQSR